MNAIDLKRAEFRHYLNACGVMDALSYALIKLYDEVDKPSDPVAFVRQHFKRPTDENEYTDIPKRVEDMNACELIKKQEDELNLARQELVNLRQLLNSMSSNSPVVSDVVTVQAKVNSYNEIFSDPMYDATLVKKYLTEELFEKFVALQGTPSIIDCISKVNALASNPFGVVALNANCYNKFSDLYEPIIKEIHCVDEFGKYPDCEWGDAGAFTKFDYESIVSTEISCCRSLANIPFIPGIGERDLETILCTVQNVIQTTRIDDTEIEGEFYKISDVKENEPIFEELQKSGLGFRSINPQQHTLWPIGRGLYINCDRTQSILINEQEHLRFVAKESHGDFGLVYKNLVDLVGKLGNTLEFERSDKFGWLTTNVGKLGSGICCTVQLKLNKPIESIKDICEQFKLNVKSLEPTDADDVRIELTNRKSFGLTEFECVKEFYENIKNIIQTLSKIEETIESNFNAPSSPIACENSNDANADAKEIDEINDNKATAENEQIFPPEESTDKTGENNENGHVTSNEGIDENPTEKENVPDENNDTTGNNDNENPPEMENVNVAENDEANQTETKECEINQNVADTTDDIQEQATEA